MKKPFKLEGIQRIDETPVHKAVSNETDDYTMVMAYINEKFARIHEEEKTDIVVEVKENNKK